MKRHRRRGPRQVEITSRSFFFKFPIKMKKKPFDFEFNSKIYLQFNLLRRSIYLIARKMHDASQLRRVSNDYPQIMHVDKFRDRGYR